MPSEQTATERLRELLDERGVEYFESPNGIAWGKLARLLHGRTYRYYAVELDGLLCMDSHCITPEQAIAATLGAGTCHEAAFCSCSECGAQLDGIYGHFCPNCGRRVVEVDE